ncbi:caspase family protein [Bradyrhizobium sp. CB82]|uniref:caspase family protein n=1 Tax=Bradyrhizobium sp. CB82 TaxID=3039159 RepID=UPI0024B1DD3C|nr:caspase family protein [Bradyrhizobium sp. CB82]WFU42736.1 caspase family protein [Bradyrhizobium sp. CB82]
MSKLEGTLKSAEDFQRWLSAKWDAEGVAAADRQIIFCSEPAVAGGRHAAAEDLTQALLDLRVAGQNSTEEFFFYFSGHGFSFVQPDARSDVLIASSYRSMDLSGSSCLQLDKAIYWLRQHLGSGHQYYFVDACRNDLDGRRINPGGIVPPSDPQTSDEATTFLLQSTAPAATAAVDGRFAASLLAGLNGKSTAKMWDENQNDTMMVRFDTLRGFVKERMKPQRVHNNVAGSDGETDAIIIRLKPPPMSRFTVQIEGNVGSPAGTIVTTGKRAPARIDTEIVGESTSFELKPDRYTVSVHVNGAQVRENDREVVVFDDATLTFQCEPPGPGVTTSTPAANTGDVAIPKSLTLELEELATGKREQFRGMEKIVVPRGRYAATILDRNDRVLNSHDIVVGPQESVRIADWSGSVPHASLAGEFDVDGGAIDFSESLGPLSDPDLNVWLALVGGGRIMSGTPYTDYSKIGRLPLQDFSHEPPGSAPVYVLAGFEDPGTVLDVAASTDPKRVDWSPATQPAGLRGLKEAVFRNLAGPILLSLRTNGGASYTVASVASPNRTTLIVATLDEFGNPVISQYLLPIGHLVDRLDPSVAALVRDRNQLADLKVIAEAERAFRSRRDILRGGVPTYFMDDVLNLKWIDPIAAAMVAYEFVRRRQPARLSVVVRNMTTYFPELPDSMALANLTGGPLAIPLRDVPLFLDGLRALDERRMPLPATAIDYNSMWTAWRGAYD